MRWILEVQVVYQPTLINKLGKYVVMKEIMQGLLSARIIQNFLKLFELTSYIFIVCRWYYGENTFLWTKYVLTKRGIVYKLIIWNRLL